MFVITMTSGAIFAIVGAAPSYALLFAVRNIQLILYNQMFLIEYPSNVLMVTDRMGAIVRWDLLESFFKWKNVVTFDPLLDDYSPNEAT